MDQSQEQTGAPREYAKFYALNIAIVAVAVLGSIVFISEPGFMDFMRVYMSFAWFTYAGFQLIGYKTFVHAFMGYDVIAARFKMYAYAYPFIEIAWGIMYLFDLFADYRDFSVVVLMTIGIFGIVRTLRSGNNIVNCACLGEVIKLPLSRVTISEDGLMLVMASAMLLFA